MKCRNQLLLLGIFAILACAALLAGGAASFHSLEIDWTEPKASVASSAVREQDAAASSKVPSGVPQSGSIDLNTATAEELQSLPGIGEKLSQRIVQYREECGRFFSVEEIMEVEGIGQKKFEAIEEYLEVIK